MDQDGKRQERGIPGVPQFRASGRIMVPFAELEERIADERARGRGIIGTSPLPDTSKPVDSNAMVNLFYVEPDPNPELQDPATITFTPEQAIAVVQEQGRHGHYGMRVQAAGPITDIRAALMTLSEVDALMQHGTPPAPPGTVPGALVILVAVRGAFVVHGPHGAGSPSFGTAYQVFDSRKGGTFQNGAVPRDVDLPGAIVVVPEDADVSGSD